MSSSNSDHKDINDRDEGVNIELDMLQEQSDHQEINDRQSEAHDDDDVQQTIHIDEKSEDEDDSADNSRDMQEYLQNGLNQPTKYEPGQEQNQNHLRNDDTNDPLETVGEATIEETTRQDITLEDKFTISYDAPKEEKKSKRGSKNKEKLYVAHNESSRILKEYNSYGQSEEESGCIESEEVITTKPLKSKNPDGKTDQSKKKQKNNNDAEMGAGSLDILDGILKQFKHCVK